MNKQCLKPFLRWAGGKNWLIKDLINYIPSSINDYHEPFLGGGSVFFHLQPRNHSYLSDRNEELINAFVQVRDNVEEVISILKFYSNTKADYYKIRSRVYPDKISRAAQFIYLNRTSFNGIYRVNLKGIYNVPYGFKNYKNLFEYDLIRNASLALKSTILKACDFEENANMIKKGDFVFIDPPYTISHIKNGFIKYNEKLFSWKDQERLSNFIKTIKSNGAFYFLTNAKHKSVKELYGDIDLPFAINRYSVVGGKNAKRGLIQEYIFTNVNNGFREYTI